MKHLLQLELNLLLEQQLADLIFIRGLFLGDFFFDRVVVLLFLALLGLLFHAMLFVQVVRNAALVFDLLRATLIRATSFWSVQYLASFFVNSLALELCDLASALLVRNLSSVTL